MKPAETEICVDRPSCSLAPGTHGMMADTAVRMTQVSVVMNSLIQPNTKYIQFMKNDRIVQFGPNYLNDRDSAPS